LASGIKSFYNRDSARSQKMMRARVGAQFMTLAIFVGYYGISEFNMKMAPMYQEAQQVKKAQQEQQQQVVADKKEG
jgi:hypothetical protein